MTLGKSPGHDLGHGGNIDFERIDLYHGLPAVLAEPGQQARHVEQLAGGAEVLQLLFGKKYKRVDGACGEPLQAAQISRRYAAIGHQAHKKLLERKPMLQLFAVLWLKHAGTPCFNW
jgi:hypothetical protein